jgi:predicted ATP-grasp superfamily ATP-dependent carboligase
MAHRGPGALLLGSDFKALGVARSLGRRGVAIGMVDNLPRSGWFSRYVARRYRWKGPMHGTAFVNFLLDVAHHEALEGWVLFPAQDETLELVAQNWESLSKVYRLVTQPWSVLKWAHDKKLLHVIAEGAGVHHPRTWYPASEDALHAMDIRFPAIVKPTISIDMQYAIGRKALPVANIEGLIQSYRRALAIVASEDIMVQEVVAGRSQYSVAAFCEDGRILSAMTARRTRQYPIDYGLSSSFVEAVEAPHLIELSHKLLRRLGTTGMVEVEFIEDQEDGKSKLLDVNPRPFGWHTLCIACGLDLPWMQYGYAIGRRPGRVLPRYGPRWVRILTDIPAGAQCIRAGLMSPVEYIRSLRGATVFSVLDPRDPLPAFGDMIVAAWRLVRVLLRRELRGPRRKTAPVNNSIAGFHIE